MFELLTPSSRVTSPSQRVLLFQRVLVLSIIINLVTLPLNFFIINRSEVVFAVQVGILLSQFVMFYPLRRGNVRTAGAILCASIWTGITVFVLNFQGVYDDSLGAYLIAIILALLFVGRTAALGILVLSGVVGFIGIGIADEQAYGDPVLAWYIHVVIMVSISFILIIWERYLTRLSAGVETEIEERITTESVLRESEARYRQILDTSPVAIRVAHLETGEILYVNPAAKNLLAVKVGDSLTENIASTILDEEGKKAAAERYEKLRRGGKIPPVEYRYHHPDGHEIDIEVGTVVNQFEGQSVVFGVINDITERKSAEQALRESERTARESEARYRSILDIAPVAIRAVHLETHEVLYVNPAAKKLLGIEVGENFLDILKRTIREDDDLQKAQERHQKLLNHEPLPPVEFLYHHPDGHEIDIEVGSILNEFEGQPVVFSVITDITKRKRAEQALRESEDRYRTISELVSDYVFSILVDESGDMRLEWVTDAHFDLTGYSEEEAKNWSRITSDYHPEDLPTVERDIQRVLAGETVEGEYRAITKDGEIRWMRVYRKPYYDSKLGRVTQFYGAAKDITAQKEAEQALSESEQRYRAISELVSDYAFLLRVNDPTVDIDDPNFGQTLWLTDAFFRIIGYAPEDYRKIAPNIDFYHPDDRIRVRQDIKTTCEGHVTTNEYRIRHKDGTYRWLRLQRQPVFDAETGKVTHFYGAGKDITTEKEAERALRESEARYRTISELISDYAFSVAIDEDGKQHLEWATDALYRVTGYTEEEVKARSGVTTAYHLDDLPIVERDIQRVLAGETVEAEYRLLTKDGGKVRWMRVYRKPYFDEEAGRVTRFYGASKDITAQKEAEFALRDSEERYRLISEMISNYAFSVRIDEDEQPHIDWISEAHYRITGYTPEEMQSKTMLTTTFHPDDVARATQDIQRVIHGEALKGEYRIITKQGEVRWLQIYRQPHFDPESGRVTHFFGAGKDVTEQKEAEHALRDSEERYRIISELVSDYAFSIFVDEDGKPTLEWITDAFYRLTGYEKDIYGKSQPPAAVYHPDDVAQVEADLERVLQGETVESEYRLLNAKGHYLHVRILRQPHQRREAGRVTGYYGVAQDITEQKEAEHALRRSERAARDFQDKLRLLHDVSTELTTITDLNDLHRRTVELGREKLGFDRLGVLLVDKDMNNVYGTHGIDTEGTLRDERNWSENISQDPKIREAVKRNTRLVVWEDTDIYDMGKVVGQGWNAMAMLWDGDHHNGWLATDNLIKGEPLSDMKLELLSLYATTVGHLITRKRAELALMESEARYRQLMDNSPVAIIVGDLGEYRLRYINPAGVRLFNAGHASNMLGKPIRDFMDQVYINKSEERIGQLLDEGLIAPEEYVINQLNGNEITIESTSILMSYEGELSALSVLQDVTRRKQAEADRLRAERLFLELEKERQLNTLQEHFITQMSHEFRTPLSVALSSKDVIQRYADRLTLEQRTDHFNRISSSIHFVVERLEDNIMLSRLEAGVLQFNPEKVRLDTTLQQHIDRLITRRSIQQEIVFQKIGNWRDALIEEDLMLRAFNKVLDNAVSYSPAESTVRVYLHRDGDNIVIEVHDNGIGIPEGTGDAIYEPFFRAANVATYPGVGLGLTVAKRCIDLYDASIDYEPNPDGGTVFTLRFPAKPTFPG